MVLFVYILLNVSGCRGTRSPHTPPPPPQWLYEGSRPPEDTKIHKQYTHCAAATEISIKYLKSFLHVCRVLETHPVALLASS